MARILDYIPLIHPVQIGTGNQELMATMVFSNLIHVKSDETTLEPSLATSWTASPDATTYTFHLGTRRLWQGDGQPVTAADVIYTIAWANQNPDAYVEDSIQAFLEVKGGADVKGTTNIPSGLVSPDPETLIVTLAAPDSIWLRNIAVAPYIILPQHILNGLTAAQANNGQFCLGIPGKTIGSGPYEFASTMNAFGASFKAVQNWWGGPVNIQEIDYNIQDSNVSVLQLEAGELDFDIRVPPTAGPAIAKVPGLKEIQQAWRRHLRAGVQQPVHPRQACSPGHRLRDQQTPVRVHSLRGVGDRQLRHPGRVQLLDAGPEHLPVRPDEGEADAHQRRMGLQQDLPDPEPER